MTNPTITQQPLPDQRTLDSMLSKAKGRLLLHKGAGFLGSLLCSHNIIWSYANNTAWCNGTQIGLNPYFFVNLGINERVTLLAHELWHTGFEHMGRVGGRHRKIWNIAADFIINNMLDTQGFSFHNMHPCLDHRYDGMTTEQVYERLMQSVQEALDEFDKIVVEGGLEEDLQDPVDATGTDIKDTIHKAIQISKMSNEAGVIPGEVDMIINTFLSPILPWETLLDRYFTELSKDDYSWARPSRRHETEYLPSLSGDNGLEHLMWYVDISGSVSDDDVRRINSEVKHVHETYLPKRLTLVTFDTEIQDIYEFTDEDIFDNIVIHGRGGTDLSEVYEHILQHKPSAAIIFSDLYCDIMENDPGSPVLWVVVDNPRAETRFGRQIHMQSEG